MSVAEDTITDLRNQYYSLHDHLDDLLDACGDDVALKREVGDIMDDALTNYLKAQNKFLNQNEDAIKQVQQKVKAAQSSIKESLDNLKEIKKVLDTLTTIVKGVGIAVSAVSG